MCAVIVLAAATALFSMAKVGEPIRLFVEDQLPTTVQTLRVARTVDALAATGTPLATASSDNERQKAFLQVDNATAALQAAMNGLSPTDTAPHDIQRLAGLLTRNLEDLRLLVDQRIEALKVKRNARERLLANLQAFKRSLIYRVRILQGDNEIIRRLIARPSPPMDRIVAMAQSSSQLIPVTRFYTEVETITGRVLAAIQDPTDSALDLSRQVLETALAEAATTFDSLPPKVAAELAQPFAELRGTVLAEEGLVALHQRELALRTETDRLIDENRKIADQVLGATSVLVHGGLDAISTAGRTTAETRQRYTLIVIVVTGLGLLGIAVLMYFHVLRNVIARLSRLSEAMRHIAAGQLDTPLPPAGNDELGQLGYAVHQFQTTAIESKRRETELRISNRKLEAARAELEANAHELEAANAKLAELSISDFLTGLANRRRFDEALETEWARARRSGQPMALLMLDIDHFKAINDRYGHQIGDACLQQVAGVISENAARAADVAARYGGEEFAVICADSDAEGARNLAEKIRQSVEELDLGHKDGPHGVVTVSVGIAALVPDDALPAKALVQAADRALYDAKEGGRNRVMTFDTNRFGIVDGDGI